jgi:hypothetical protein
MLLGLRTSFPNAHPRTLPATLFKLTPFANIKLDSLFGVLLLKTQGLSHRLNQRTRSAYLVKRLDAVARRLVVSKRRLVFFRVELGCAVPGSHVGLRLCLELGDVD